MLSNVTDFFGGNRIDTCPDVESNNTNTTKQETPTTSWPFYSKMQTYTEIATNWRCLPSWIDLFLYVSVWFAAEKYYRTIPQHNQMHITNSISRKSPYAQRQGRSSSQEHSEGPASIFWFLRTVRLDVITPNISRDRRKIPSSSHLFRNDPYRNK